MGRRRTTDQVKQLKEAAAAMTDVARVQSGAAPVGYEHYGIDWGRLTPREAAIVTAFADALREVRELEADLLRLGTVDHVRGMLAELRRQCAEMREAGCA